MHGEVRGAAARRRGAVDDGDVGDLLLGGRGGRGRVARGRRCLCGDRRARGGRGGRRRSGVRGGARRRSAIWVRVGVNWIRTRILARIGAPARVAGSKRQPFTASSAARSKASPPDSATVVSPIEPSRSTVTKRMTLASARWLGRGWIGHLPVLEGLGAVTPAGCASAVVEATRSGNAATSANKCFSHHT